MRQVKLAITPELAARFQADCAALIDTARTRIGLAVSGGADSLALLLLAHHAWPDRIAAATVDHGLRPEAAEEAAYVARICAALGVPHQTLTPTMPIKGSLQAAARVARYHLLAEWAEAQSCDWIATAHHADDQVETLLMRLNRGAGLAGLAGVRAVNGRIFRPLLQWRRSELSAIVRASGIIPVDDPSNADESFDRVRLRKVLADVDWINTAHWARSAAALADAESSLDWAVDRLVAERMVLGVDKVRFDPSLLPRALLRRLTLRALQYIDPMLEPRGDALSALIMGLKAGETRTLGVVKVRGGDVWRFSRAAARRAAG